MPVDARRRRLTGLMLGAPFLAATAWLTGCAGLALYGGAGGKWAGVRGNPALSNPPPWRPALALDPSTREAVVAQALLLVNTPYRYGGNTPEGGFDCSGLVCYVFAQAVPGAARQLPRSTAQWAAVTTPVDQPQRGDLVFFNIGAPFAHMGIYAGNAQFVHAPATGGVVRENGLQSGYFAAHYQGARRAFAA